MKKINKILCVIIAMYSSGLFGKDLPPIQIDRPDQTESPSIVPKNYLQIETGFSSEKVNKNVQNNYLPSALFKYGLNDVFEFRLITEVLSTKINNTVTNGLKPVTIGFKVKIAEENGIVPITSFIGHLKSPDLGSKEFKTSYFTPAFRFLMQHQLTKDVILSYNLGAEWDGETPEPKFIYTLSTVVSLTEKIGTYIEVYGFIPQKLQADHRIDGGFTYLINNNLILDYSAGIGITDNSPDYYNAIGISYRFNTTKKNKN